MRKLPAANPPSTDNPWVVAPPAKLLIPASSSSPYSWWSWPPGRVAVAETRPSTASSQLHVVVPLSTLPLHLRLTLVHVTPDGLRIGAAARHVQFART
jgi:hypothetical protein